MQCQWLRTIHCKRQIHVTGTARYHTLTKSLQCWTVFHPYIKKNRYLMLHTGWAKKTDWFWKVITLWQLVVEICVIYVGGRNLCDICQNLAISSRKKNIKLACQCIKYSLPNLLIPHVTLRCLTGRNIKHQMLAYSEPKVADSCFIETGNYEKTNVFS